MAILVVDDEPSLRRSLRAYLEDMDHEVLEAGDGLEGLSVLRARPVGVAAAVVDLNMPVMDGYSFIRHAVAEFPELPLVVLSGVGIVEDALRAMRLGAWDFITKPLSNLGILDLVLAKVLDRARLVRENREYRENLERLVGERTRELELTRRQVMQRLSRAAEYKDNETGHHVIRVGEISYILAQAMGLPEPRCDMLRECAPLHDVGKIGIPDAVLLKPGPLDADEMEIMRRHCLYGCELLGPLTSKSEARQTCLTLLDARCADPNELLTLARILAMYHHERWDGTGYPIGLKGPGIPIEARIVAVVDVYDALRSDRPYKKTFSEADSQNYLREMAGSQFDPAVIEAFFKHIEGIRTIREKWKD